MLKSEKIFSNCKLYKNNEKCFLFRLKSSFHSQDISIFVFEKSFTKCGGETIPRHFSKNSKLSISLDQQSKALYSLLSLYAKLRISKYIETKLQTNYLYLIQSFLKRQNEVWNQPPSRFFYLIFEEKYLSYYILLTDQISLSGCFCFVRYWAICVLQLFVNHVVRS